MKTKKTNLAKSLHDLAVNDVKESITRKVSNNVSLNEMNVRNNNVTEYVTVNSSVKDIFSALQENCMEEYNKVCAYNAFRAKYSELYNIYGVDIENDIIQMYVNTLDLTIDFDGNECTPIQAVKSFISFGVKNDVEFCTPIRKENKRYIDGIKALKKETKKTAKETAKKETKKTVLFYSLSYTEKIRVKTDEFIKLGCDKNMAAIMAKNFVDNLK